ncbi:MAG TPA: ROK family protein [Bacteroidetes bacterium]|nr:ROK family protein [Bacteroidota bacterium]
MQTKNILGIDVGGSGIKGAVVNIEKGALVTERMKIATPKPSTPEAVAEVFAELIGQQGYEGQLIGCGFPSIMKEGVCYSASNIDKSWKGVDVAALFSKVSGRQVFVSNDADVAGLSEMRYGVGKGLKGSVLLITIGTGLGTALFTDGHLVQNTEFGHIPFKGKAAAEKYISNSVRKKENLDWDEFGRRFNEYLEVINRILSPNLIIIGGGISSRYHLFEEHINVEAEVKTAEMFNHAGIIGAALFAKLEAGKAGALR